MGPLILLAGTVAFTAWIAPHLPVPGEKPAAVAPAPDDAAAETPREAWLSGGTVLDRAADGHFYADAAVELRPTHFLRSEEHTSELQSLMRISYAVFCLQKKTHNIL